ncbi:MAG: hypothetical protein AAGU74_03170 [Bacillota bacterium]
MISIAKILLAHAAKYPQMQVQDAVKLIYQNEFGAEHFACDETSSLSRLSEEVASLPEGAFTPLFESIGNGAVRLNLAACESSGLSSGLSLCTINRMFLAQTGTAAGSERSFGRKLAVLLSLSERGLLPYNKSDVEDSIQAYRSAGVRPISHSGVYKQAYSPAYRVIGAQFRKYAKIFMKIDRLLMEQQTVNVAIDGMCCAGKTTLARLLSQIYDCNVLHMDDFFLPAELRTKERLFSPGGNIHYERFEDQVLKGLKSSGDFAYQRYDCDTMQLSAPVVISRKRLNIVEGVYCLRPEWVPVYDLKIFLSTGPKRQRSRVLRRCGSTALQERFLTEWIPLENRYFETFNIREGCDLKYYS